jgi:hypothetical protein
MKTDVSKTRNCWPLLALAAVVVGACGPVADEPVEAEFLEIAEQEALTGVTLGLGTGNIYGTSEQPLSVFAENIFCEYSNMGAKWVRIEAGSPSIDAVTYQRIVQKAKSKGIKVLVVVPAQYCGDDADQAQVDAFTTAYVNHLNDLATNVFIGPAQADAYEIGNEPNVQEARCADAATRYRVGPNAFGWLLRRVWQWKTANARPETIVSGGIFNTYTVTDPYYNALFASGGFTGFPGSRPFDYFGIHPYDNAYLDTACIDTEASTCFYHWKLKVAAGLKAVAAKVNTGTGTTNSKLFATEFGFQLAICNTDNCVRNTYQMSAGFHAAGEALVNSGVTPHAIWATYRDDNGERFGLRSVWDGDTNKYMTRQVVWNKFYSLAGGAGSINTETCWAPGTYASVYFEDRDGRRTTITYDWVWAWRGECAPGERMMGLSKSPTTGGPRTGLCFKDPLDAGRYTHQALPEPGDTNSNDNCLVLSVQAGSSNLPAGQPPRADWDPGNYKADCGPNRYVAAFGNSTSTHKLTHVLCCPVSNVSNSSCNARVFGAADNRETTTSGNWDSAGIKGECGTNRYMVGVSVTPAGDPNALLCCSQ